MGLAHERLTGKCLTVLTVDADHDVLAIYEDFSISASQATIDLTAVQDTWEATALGWNSWEATISNFIDGTEDWLAELDSQQFVVLTCDPGGKTFVGTAVLTAGGISAGKGAQMNTVTLKGAMAPSIS